MPSALSFPTKPPHTRSSTAIDPIVQHRATYRPTQNTRNFHTGEGNIRPNNETNSSDSDPEFADQGANSRPRHSRSMSNPFPSLFSSKKKYHGPTAQSRLESRGGRNEASASLSPAPSHHHRSESNAVTKDFTTGNCMTCDSLVRWPRHVRTFKCTICATVNDLVPLNSALSPASQVRVDDAFVNGLMERQISTERTQQLVRECLSSFIEARCCSTGRISPDRLPHISQENVRPISRDPLNSPLLNADLDHAADSLPSTTYVPRFVFTEEPTLHRKGSRPVSVLRSNSAFQSARLSDPRYSVNHNPSSPHNTKRPPSQRGDPNKLFRPVEDYVIQCFASFDTLNASFLSPLGTLASKASREAIRKHVASRGEHGPLRASRENSPKKPGTNAPMALSNDSPSFDLDPKLLMLGDVAENGFWWTGVQDKEQHALNTNRHEDLDTKLVSTRSANIDWLDLEAWYSSTINCASGWVGVYSQISESPSFTNPTQNDLQMMERDIITAQAHVQRVLLKATELLLKRPGRVIRSPNDMRFLFILLENPLLYSQFEPFNGLLRPESDDDVALTRASRTVSGIKAPGPVSGHHSGIIKRILGIVSNTSTECHSHVIAWLANYDQARFLRTKELASQFLTYRLLHEMNKVKHNVEVDLTAGLIPRMQTGRSGAYLHDEIGSHQNQRKRGSEGPKKVVYDEDWQIRAASRVIALIFAANNSPHIRQQHDESTEAVEASLSAVRDRVQSSGQRISTSDFYISMVDNADLIADFEMWESKRPRFSFCQYPFLLSVWAKTQILEYDARRQMQNKARDAFFDNIMTHKNVNPFWALDVRRECLVEDSLKAVSEVIGSGGEDVKKGLKISFKGEEGIDGGGLRKEWFLLLVREVFNPDHGMFVYDDDSQYCYFNPNSFETSDQFFLVGVVMGLAIYNSTILDVALPPFAFRKLVASAPTVGVGSFAHPRPKMRYSLNDLEEYQPRLAQGLRRLLEFEGDVEGTFGLDFCIDAERYGATTRISLCPGGERKLVTNKNRKEFVDLYVRYVLDTAVSRQFEPFKRGFYTVCGGNAFSLFRPEEIELLVRGSDKALDVSTLRAVAEYHGWNSKKPEDVEPIIAWFWEAVAAATPGDQRKLLLFITGSDRVPAMGAAMLPIKLSCLGDDQDRFPIARTCFNQLSLWRYTTKERLESKLWRAVHESEGFGLK